MCGIAGTWRVEPPTNDELSAMAQSLRHRGPDDHGIWIDAEAGVGFAHTRLAIVDLSAAGHQPMRSASGRYELVYNGEIYNHDELRSLVDPVENVQWRGHSDTETLLAMIERFGLEEALSKSIGMFALALWDRETRTLSLARDRLGEKPLYYGWANGSFLFASELKAMRTVPGFAPPVDRAALDCLLRFLAVPAPRSIHEGIFKLMPGTILTLGVEDRTAMPSGFDGRAGNRITSYWSIDEVIARGPSELGGEDAEALLEQLLIASVQRQSVADVPVGTFLSGGYDSTLVAALQQAHGGSRVETFTIGFDEAGFDEAPHARAVAAHLGTDHHEMRVSSANALVLIPELPSIYDEPFADSSQIPTTLLSRLARRHVTVALSGDGGDELFGGYNRYVAFAKSRKALAAVPAPLRRAAGAALGAIGSDRIDRLGRWTRIDRRFPQPGQKSQKLATLLRNGKTVEKLFPELTSHWGASERPVLDTAPCASRLAALPGIDEASRMMAWDMADYLPNDILAKVDRASMSASLETRAPFLDHHVVECALGLPSAMKIGSDGGKAIMRNILYRYVPRKLLDRPKAGFAIPLGQWLRGPLRDWAETLLAPDALSDHFDVAVIRNRWATHLSGHRDDSLAIWPVLMFQAWRG
ncbi:asparagine synthase (glutamine-hydrolyzing) [Sphingomonas sp. HDW15A]|uniref:asparagine synthase (glutamine-hydrolyzing) n=1 Tax=Sphingomonas sp. HDW15A TaxID=2714942 RepID=UPI00140D95E8|nr:asparagine synthase (glutamine-hydrolyzing) [Sphingomonas sp. HDW15A]QIK95833.1 asparagine synthase (glutamine-hydrolyzing) [Sphingomonas sp. HDW15A]